MNPFLDVTANQRSSLTGHKTYSDVKQLSPKLTHTPLAQQSNNTNHCKTQTNSQSGSGQTKNHNRRTKHSTYQSNGKKRNFSGTHNSNLDINSVENRPNSRLGNNSNSNHNAGVSGKRGDKIQTKNSFDSVRSTNISSSVGSNSSTASSEGSNIKSSKGDLLCDINRFGLKIILNGFYFINRSNLKGNKFQRKVICNGHSSGKTGDSTSNWTA